MKLVRGVVTALALLACAACVPEGLAFVADDRLTITSPSDEDRVRLPVTLRWKIEDFDIVDPGTPVRDGAGYFGVFVDRSPMPPGEDLAWLAREDDTCESSRGCPDAAYLAERDIYVTTDTQLDLTELEEGPEGRRERHRATIVLLDSAGRRLGESAFYVDFEVLRGEQ